MHFTKTLVSLFALGSFASASFSEADESVDLAAREAEFLSARAEYIQARDNYIMEKRGNTPSKYKASVCFERQCKEKFNGKMRVCGSCNKRDGKSCTCEY
ncbi:unnamed protein product [Clonostachys rosea]|uniref:Uncharacterized protein n=1 Tax=Bionectria ochroleuca TaxID=29856 RepID=A0ABY6V3L6_BIOOC|nr:unnamed protein product [Clonostachys rosea]